MRRLNRATRTFLILAKMSSISDLELSILKTESELNKSPAGENDESEKTECPVFESFFNQPDVQLYALLTEQFYDRKGVVSFDKSQKGNERAGRKGRTVTGFVFLPLLSRIISNLNSTTAGIPT